MKELFLEEARLSGTNVTFMSFYKKGVFDKYIKESENNNLSFSYVRLSKINKNTVSLDEIYIKESDRNNGLGSRFIKEALAFAIKKGYKKITLKAEKDWCNTPREILDRFYKKYGFTNVKDNVYERTL